MEFKDFEDNIKLDYDYDNMSDKEIYEEKKSIILREVRSNFNLNHKKLKKFLNILVIIILIPLILVTLIFEIIGAIGNKIDDFTVWIRDLVVDNVAISFWKKDIKKIKN